VESIVPDDAVITAPNTRGSNDGRGLRLRLKRKTCIGASSRAWVGRLLAGNDSPQGELHRRPPGLVQEPSRNCRHPPAVHVAGFFISAGAPTVVRAKNKIIGW